MVFELPKVEFVVSEPEAWLFCTKERLASRLAVQS